MNDTNIEHKVEELIQTNCLCHCWCYRQKII